MTSEHVYHAVKARVTSRDLHQGQRIQLEPIAHELGVSTKPIREALNRLAAEELVIKAPRNGFIAMILSEDNTMGQYQLTCHLLSHVLETLKPTARQDISKCETTTDILNRLNHCEMIDAVGLATYTGKIFAHIASLSEAPRVIRSINTANDHLYYVRTLEYQHLDHIQSELACLYELLLAGEFGELTTAIQEYHDRRVTLLPTLLEFFRQ